ncbi:MAG: adenosylcobinamide-GDP ribazoletransferase [Candidatus Omnitrophica bacterium]|nr:adenosylcobinamide-GDP ribazoletransferase [Candidatus Omnitrophota bacterium]MDD5237597.1 adenosylcobinamide-GDP ribazoletransferase [Candidatus Omnitrophota bacterium]
MKNFLLAIQFLLIIPLKIKDVNDKEIARSMAYFPLVGLFLGLILAGINYLLHIFGFERFSIDIILIISLAILTGGIHLDGLSDTFDGILSRKGREQMLLIMRDSHAGVMGILSIISVILLKIALLYSVTDTLKIKALLLTTVLSRWGMVFAIFLFSYARQDGKARAFIKDKKWTTFFISTFLTFILAAFILKIMGLIILLIAAFFVYVMGKFITNKLGGITGDTLGAINEITEVIILFILTIWKGGNLWMI